MSTGFARRSVVFARRQRWIRRGLPGWTAGRDLPVPAAQSFRERWPAR
ncbi:MAG: hypothetical protein ACRDV7_08220 [Acidimicrobiia bacterium]